MKDKRRKGGRKKKREWSGEGVGERRNGGNGKVVLSL